MDIPGGSRTRARPAAQAGRTGRGRHDKTGEDKRIQGPPQRHAGEPGGSGDGGGPYTDKVREYMNFWCQLKRLEADVAERGVSVMDAKRGMPVENRSVSLAVQVSRQMLAIYTALGFKDEPSQGGGDDEL